MLSYAEFRVIIDATGWYRSGTCSSMGIERLMRMAQASRAPGRNAWIIPLSLLKDGGKHGRTFSVEKWL